MRLEINNTTKYQIQQRYQDHIQIVNPFAYNLSHFGELT